MGYDFREDLLFHNLMNISRNKKDKVNWFHIIQCLNSKTNEYKFRDYDEKSVRSRVYRVEKAGISKRKCKICASDRGSHICATEFELAYYKSIIAKMAFKLWEEVEYTEQEEAPQEEEPLEEPIEEPLPYDADDDWDESAFYEGLEIYGLATYNVCNLELDMESV